VFPTEECSRLDYDVHINDINTHENFWVKGSYLNAFYSNCSMEFSIVVNILLLGVKNNEKKYFPLKINFASIIIYI